MIRSLFDKELNSLHKDMLKMSLLVCQSIKDALIAFNNNDLVLAKIVANGDNNIDEIEKKIETKVLRILLRQQPVAKDLRIVSAILKVITDMERIGDQAADIAKISMNCHIKNNFLHINLLEEMKDLSLYMVNNSMQAFIKIDKNLALDIFQKDDIIDELFVKIRNYLIKLLETNIEYANQIINVLMVAKYLERITDHTVNICEWVMFIINGKHKNKK